MGLLQHFTQNIKRHQTRFKLFTLAFILIARATAAYFDWGWHFAASLAFGMTAVFLAYAFIMHDDLLKKVVFFAIVAGFTELAADWWLVDITQTLVYAPDEPFIWKSPVYMPFAWAMVLTNIGFLSYMLMFKEPKWLAILITVLVGATVIPLFEHWAKGAGWWYYQNCSMIWDVPYYIILGEGLICALLGLIVSFLNNHNWTKVFLLGVFQGLWIWASYYVAFFIFENLPS